MCTAPMGANVNYAMDHIIAQCLSSRHCTIMGANVEQRQDTYKTRTRHKAIYYEIPTKLKNVEQRQDTYKTRTRCKAMCYEIPTKLKMNKTKKKNCLPCVEAWKDNVAMTRI